MAACSRLRLHTPIAASNRCTQSSAAVCQAPTPRRCSPWTTAVFTQVPLCGVNWAPDSNDDSLEDSDDVVVVLDSLAGNIVDEAYNDATVLQKES